MNILVGADPELFVKDGEQFISGIGLVGGTKDNPQAMGCGAVQMDNVLLEYNIPPARSADEFVTYNSQMMAVLEQYIYPRKLVAVGSHEYSLDYLESLGPVAMTLGCEPDLNVWTRRFNPRPNARQGLRSGAGHIHVSFENRDRDVLARLVQIMDAHLGLPSVLMDSDTTRRNLYGKAGSFRFTDYGGVEYRVLSNFWLRSQAEMRWAYNSTIKSVNLLSNEEYYLQVMCHGTDIQAAINNSDGALAHSLMQELNVGAVSNG